MLHIRLPDPKEIDAIVAGDSDRAASGERKLKTAVANALQAMATAQKKNLKDLLKDLEGVHFSERDVNGLLNKDVRLNNTKLRQLKQLIAAIQAADPLSRHPGAVKATRSLNRQERTIIGTLATDAANRMREIARGLHDPYVKNVFGSHAGDAKKIFGEAADALDRMRPGILFSSIVVDTMNTAEVWRCGGLTNSDRMKLPESAIEAAGKDDLKKKELKLLLVHESTHAIPSDRATTDMLYEHHEGFSFASEQVKLKTADYYKEVVRQIETGTPRVFKPRDVSPHLAEKRSIELRQAAVKADRILNGAWITAIRIYGIVRDMALRPWAYVNWDTWLQNASRLMGITLHRETVPKFEWHLCGGSTGPKITAVDLAAIDNKIAMLAACNGKATSIMAEPPQGRDPVDHVLDEVLSTYCPDLKFRKSREKDLAVIRSLAECHESVNRDKRNLVLDPVNSNLPGLRQLPGPMRRYNANAQKKPRT